MGWKAALDGIKQEEWFKELFEEIKRRYQSRTVYPPKSELFKALELTPYEDVKIVILGQDPYHGPNQAMGLAFGVRPGVSIPPSLRNIYKELKADLGVEPPTDGDLRGWARQGVLLLNTTLTVERGRPNAHKGLGWETFTERVIASLNDHPQRVVFLLWGRHAQSKRPLIDESRHLVLEASHPSPFSARYSFFGCRHFSKANEFLQAHGREPVDFSR